MATFTEFLFKLVRLAGALGSNGCTYHMPFNASLERFYLGIERNKYGGAVSCKDGMIYGIPYEDE